MTSNLDYFNINTAITVINLHITEPKPQIQFQLVKSSGFNHIYQMCDVWNLNQV